MRKIFQHIRLAIIWHRDNVSSVTVQISWWTWIQNVSSFWEERDREDTLCYHGPISSGFKLQSLDFHLCYSSPGKILHFLYYTFPHFLLTHALILKHFFIITSIIRCQECIWNESFDLFLTIVEWSPDSWCPVMQVTTENARRLNVNSSFGSLFGQFSKIYKLMCIIWHNVSQKLVPAVKLGIVDYNWSYKTRSLLML